MISMTYASIKRDHVIAEACFLKEDGEMLTRRDMHVYNASENVFEETKEFGVKMGHIKKSSPSLPLIPLSSKGLLEGIELRAGALNKVMDEQKSQRTKRRRRSRKKANQIRAMQAAQQAAREAEQNLLEAAKNMRRVS